MKTKQNFYTLFLLLLMGCGNAKLSQSENKSNQSVEEMISKALEIYAQESPQCSVQKLALVKGNQSHVQRLVTQLKGLSAPTAAGLNMKALQNYADTSESDQFHVIVQVLTGKSFKTVLMQSADLIKQVAKDSVIMTNLSGIHDDLGLEPGDRVAELLSMLATNQTQRQTLLQVTKLALCTETASEKTILDALQSPAVLWQLGPNGVYLLGSSLAHHAEPLWKTMKALPIPKELTQFISLMKNMLPTGNMCTLENLNAYAPHFEILAALLDGQDQRPLKSLINMLFKVYTMEESNQCSGISFDDLKQEKIENAFLKIADFLSDEQEGIPAFLQKIKPRS